MTINIVALVLSAVALGISTWLAVRQALQQKRATHLPAYLGMLSEFRSREFNDHYLYVCEKLSILSLVFPGFRIMPEKRFTTSPITIRSSQV